MALLDYDKTRKLSGEYVLLTQAPVRWQILSHPLFTKVIGHTLVRSSQTFTFHFLILWENKFVEMWLGAVNYFMFWSISQLFNVAKEGRGGASIHTQPVLSYHHSVRVWAVTPFKCLINMS